jgi:hypothetical protein
MAPPPDSSATLGAKPGLRVRLAGTEGNLTAIGAQLRLISGARKGPLREIRAGSGYWSQDSCVQVVAAPEAGAKVWVRWPGGKETVTEIRLEHGKSPSPCGSRRGHRRSSLTIKRELPQLREE